MKQVSIFDLDKTLLKVNCSFKFGAYLYKKGQFSFLCMLHHVFCYTMHRLGLLSIPDLHQKIFNRLFRNSSLTDIETLAQSFVALSFTEMLYLPAVKKLQEAQQQGHYTVILSSSPSFLVKLIAERFNVNEWGATHYAVDSDQRFTFISQWMLSDDKANYIKDLIQRLKIEKKQITAYSDSALDLSFLKAAGVAVAVNPDRTLLSISKENQWTVI